MAVAAGYNQQIVSREPVNETLTVIDGANRVQSCAGAHDNDRPTLWLCPEVVGSERDRVDDTVKVDVYCVLVGLDRIAVLVELKGQVVCAWANAGIGKHKVNFTILFLGSLKELNQIRPNPDVGLYKVIVGVGRRWWLDIAAHN